MDGVKEIFLYCDVGREAPSTPSLRARGLGPGCSGLADCGIIWRMISEICARLAQEKQGSLAVKLATTGIETSAIGRIVEWRNLKRKQVLWLRSET
jgi:hypothetical protein